jgi:cell division protein ZapA
MVEQRKNEFKDLSNKFKELKSLIYEYRDKKEDEIKKLNFNQEDFKVEIENNQKKYEQLIDEAADQISNFVKKAKIDNLSQ